MDLIIMLNHAYYLVQLSILAIRIMCRQCSAKYMENQASGPGALTIILSQHKLTIKAHCFQCYKFWGLGHRELRNHGFSHSLDGFCASLGDK
jgi:hypothetical protein